VGLYNPTNTDWHLYSDFSGTVQSRTYFRTPRVPTSWVPIAGDWNDDGLDTVGLYGKSTSTWYLNDEIDGTIDTVRSFRTPTVPTTWVPLTGNWDGSGIFDGGTGPAPINAGLSAAAAAPASTALKTASVQSSTSAPSKKINASLVDAAMSLLASNSDLAPSHAQRVRKLRGG
jgi:hypothetical protein